MSLPITEKLIQRQLNHWHRFREFLHEDPSAQNPNSGPVITVSRLAGSGGRTLATALAERLDLDMHDHSLVDRICADRDVERSLVAKLDETAVSQANLWVKGVLQQKIFLRDQYHMALAKAVTSLAAIGGVVFLGRGANLILGENCSLRIRVVAPQARRIDNVRHRENISKAEARTLVNETDRRREDFIKRVFRENPGRPRNFDLTFNSDRLSLDNMIELSLLALLNRQTVNDDLKAHRSSG